MTQHNVPLIEDEQTVRFICTGIVLACGTNTGGYNGRPTFHRFWGSGLPWTDRIPDRNNEPHW
jgi:hypothetical protein